MDETTLISMFLCEYLIRWLSSRMTQTCYAENNVGFSTVQGIDLKTTHAP